MARLPSVDDTSIVPVRPKGSVAGYNNAGAPGAALAEVGSTIQRIGDIEQERMDNIRVDSALTQLRQKEVELTYGKEGYLNVKGQNAIDRPIADDFGKQYDTAIGGLGAGLTGRQRAAFESRAKQGRATFQAGVYRHALSQADQVDATNFKVGLETEQDAAYKSGGETLAVQTARANTRALLKSRFERLGITDAKVQAQMEKDAFGALHAAVINGLIKNDKTSLASEYYEANKVEINAEQQQSIEGKLKPLKDNEAGVALGNEAYKMIQAGKSQTDVALYLTDKAKGSPHIEQAAKVQLAYLQAAEQKDDQQKRGSYYMAYNNGQSAKEVLNAVRKDPNLNDTQRNEIIEHIENKEYSKLVRQNAALSRDAAAAARNDRLRARNPENVAEYYRVISDPNFRNLTPEQIAAKEPKLGGILVDNLYKEQFEQKEAVARKGAAFSIPRDQIDQQRIYAGATSKKDKERFEGIVSVTLRDWKNENPGKVPSPDDVKNILHSGAKQYRDFTGWDSTISAYRVSDPARAVPQDFYEAQIKAGVDDDEKVMVGLWQGYQRMRAQVIEYNKSRNLPPPSEAVLLQAFEAKRKTGAYK